MATGRAPSVRTGFYEAMREDWLETKRPADVDELPGGSRGRGSWIRWFSLSFSPDASLSVNSWKDGSGRANGIKQGRRRLARRGDGANAVHGKLTVERVSEQAGEMATNRSCSWNSLGR